MTRAPRSAPAALINNLLRLRGMPHQPPQTDVRVAVDQLLDQAVVRGASDLHLEPTSQGLEARYRIDGLLETVATYDAAMGRSLVTRLMVMAHLLTYRLDV